MNTDPVVNWTDTLHQTAGTYKNALKIERDARLARDRATHRAFRELHAGIEERDALMEAEAALVRATTNARIAEVEWRTARSMLSVVLATAQVRP